MYLFMSIFSCYFYFGNLNQFFKSNLGIAIGIEKLMNWQDIFLRQIMLRLHELEILNELLQRSKTIFILVVCSLEE